MTLSGFISKLNWRLILIHLLACWFFYYATVELAILYDYKFLIHLMITHYRGNTDFVRSNFDILWMGMAELISILIAFLVSLVVSIRKKWFWLNSVIVLLSAFGLMILWARLKVRFTPWHYLKQIFLTPGEIFDNTVWFFVINGSVLLAIGLCLFFLKSVNRFIDGKNATAAPLRAGGQTDAYEPTVQP